MKSKLLTIIILSGLGLSGYTQGGFALLNHSFISTPQVGVLIQNVSGTDNKIRVVKDSLGSKYIRLSAIAMRNFTGTNSAYERALAEGLIQHVVIDVGATDAAENVPWITDETSFNLTQLVSRVDLLLSKYKGIKVLILDNEELNVAKPSKAYHVYGTLYQYIDIAERLQPVCKKYNVKLANGGFGAFYSINGWAFRWIKAKYGQSTADAFGSVVFNNGTSGRQYRAANGTCNASEAAQCAAFETDISNVDTVVMSNVFDYLNIHMYEVVGVETTDENTETIPKENEWRYYSEAYRYGNPNRLREVINNETGQRSNEEPDLVNNMLHVFWKFRFRVLDWWSGNGAELDARPLTENTGKMKSNGYAYKDFCKRYKGLGSTK